MGISSGSVDVDGIGDGTSGGPVDVDGIGSGGVVDVNSGVVSANSGGIGSGGVVDVDGIGGVVDGIGDPRSRFCNRFSCVMTTVGVVTDDTIGDVS